MINETIAVINNRNAIFSREILDKIFFSLSDFAFYEIKFVICIIFVQRSSFN